MYQRLINHNPDLKKLQDEGYEIEIMNGFLLIHHIPYVTTTREIKFGVLACQLNLISNEKVTRPGNHVIFFQGDHPCDKQGRIIQAIRHNSTNQTLFGSFAINHSFSNKPPNGYADYYEKVTTYAEVISAPAKSIDPEVTEKTFKVLVDGENTSVFQYIDSNSSRANIYAISEKLIHQKIAIIGLGGTGAYILDLVAKSPVSEIHLFDGDVFLQHNAFRSPGAATIDLLEKQLKKVCYYQQMYSNIHRHIVSHDEFVNEDNLEVLKNMSCIFISIDRGRVKKTIMDYLIQNNIPFIDVGMGINRVDDSLIGTLRVTTTTKNKNDHLEKRIPISDDKDDEYNTNIQIAELNALNAALAVIKWKKLCGFYNDLENEHHTTYSINVSQLLNDEIAT
jgi:molybdopterin/thiamine biosynthesis adenylyltransferase